MATTEAAPTAVEMPVEPTAVVLEKKDDNPAAATTPEAENSAGDAESAPVAGEGKFEDAADAGDAPTKASEDDKEKAQEDDAVDDDGAAAATSPSADGETAEGPSDENVARTDMNTQAEEKEAVEASVGNKRRAEEGDEVAAKAAKTSATPEVVEITVDA